MKKGIVAEAEDEVQHVYGEIGPEMEVSGLLVCGFRLMGYKAEN